jgi:Asp-tRNA(Asn)/Glu-tRNA(Gln) amidotransferase A subunit family amidase
VTALVDSARVSVKIDLSVQLVGPVGAEDVLSALARQLAAARPWVQHRPRFGAIIRP